MKNFFVHRPVPTSQLQTIPFGRNQTANDFIAKTLGPILGVNYVENHPDDPPIYNTFAVLSPLSKLGPAYPADLSDCGGASLSLSGAVQAALGEAIERMAMLCQPQRTLISSFEGLPYQAATDLTWLRFFSQSNTENSFEPITPSSCIQWENVWNITSNRPALYPSSLIRVPFILAEGEKPISDSVSTGAACSWDQANSIMNGLFECIERDAIMGFWHHGALPEKFSDEQLDILLGVDSRRLFQDQFRLTMLYLPTDLGAHVCFCICQDQTSKGLGLCVGASCSSDLATAASKAVIEALQGRVWIRYLKNAGELDDISSADEPQTFKDHVAFYATKSGHFIQSVLSQSRAFDDDSFRSLRSNKFSYQSIVKCFSEKGYDILAADITPTDLNYSSIHTTKVICPQLVPLHVGRCVSDIKLGGRRFPEIFKGANIQHKFDLPEINPEIHPFP